MKRLSALAVLCAAMSSAAANAQFMDLLKNAVGNAAANAVTNAATSATRSAIDGAVSGVKSAGATPAPAAQSAPAGEQPAAAQPISPGASQAQARPPAPAGCSPYGKNVYPALGSRPATIPAVLWPTEPACGAYFFDDYDFSAGKPQVEAFAAIGNGPCKHCPGGNAMDAQAHVFTNKDPKYAGKRFDEVMATLPRGERIEWQGQLYSGTIELTGEEPIGPFPCRQYHWTLWDKNRNVAAEREGLYCKSKRRSNEPRWHKVL